MIGAITAGLFGIGVPPVTNSYESIASASGTGSSAVIDFTSIPSTYKHLQVRGIARTTGAGTESSGTLQFNNDGGSNYSYHQLYGLGSGTPSASGGGSFTGIDGLSGTASGSASGIYGVFIIDILDYQSTTKNKTVRLTTGFDQNGSGLILFRGGAWYNSGTAISSLKLTGGNNWTTDSRFALYGIKG